MREACKSWKDGFDLSVTQIRIRPLFQDLPLDPFAPEDAAGGPRISLPASWFFPELKKLTLNSYSLFNLSLSTLLGSPKLSELHLIGCTFHSGVFQGLEALPLVALNLHFSQVTCDTLIGLHGLSVTSLSLEYIEPGLRDFTMLGLRGMTQLQELNLTGYKTRVSDEAFAVLADLPQLRVLCLEDWFCLGGVTVTPEGFGALRKLPLTALSLADREGSHGEFITDEFLWELRGLPLTALDLEGCNRVSDEGLKALEGMPLTHLDLTNIGCWRFLQFTGEGVKFLRGSPLTSLHLRGTGFTDEKLRELVGLPLKSLYLRDCRGLTDVGLGYLRDFPLTSLDLSGPYSKSFSDQALLGLRDMPHLKQLWLGESGYDSDGEGIPEGVAEHVVEGLMSAGICLVSCFLKVLFAPGDLSRQGISADCALFG